MGLSYNLLFFILLATSFSITLRRVEGAPFTSFKIGNGCGYTVWVGLLTGSGTAPTTMIDGRRPSGFMLKSHASATIEMPHGWSGRLWGRVGCNFTSNGVGTCQSGDCGGKLDCAGVGATPPATLIEFTLQGATSTRDFYDVSLVDGFNLPITITPGGTYTKTNQTSCGVAGCSFDINTKCPSQFQVVVDDKVVSCKSACLALSEDQYCCSGAFSNSNTCKPSTYSKTFKAACPHAYTYAYDDLTSLFTCIASNYTITFCPSSSSPSSAATKNGIYKLSAYVGVLYLLFMYIPNNFHYLNKF